MHIYMHENDDHHGRRTGGTCERTDRNQRENRVGARGPAGADCTRERAQVGRPGWDGFFCLGSSQASPEAGNAVILVDSSVWIEHFCSSSSRLRDRLEQGLVLAHPFVIGELAL